MSAGIPDEIGDLTVGFPYGDLAATEELLTRHDGRGRLPDPGGGDPARSAGRATSKACATSPTGTARC